jgi:hypothetical protein
MLQQEMHLTLLVTEETSSLVGKARKKEKDLASIQAEGSPESKRKDKEKQSLLYAAATGDVAATKRLLDQGKYHYITTQQTTERICIVSQHPLP